MNYTELQVTTNFSFLRGASHPEEIIEAAAEYGYTEIAVTDCNTLAGVVRAHAAAKKKGILLITGCRLDLVDGVSLLAYPTDKEAYSRLCTLLTRGNLRTEKGKCELYKQDVHEHTEGMKLIAIPPVSLNSSFDFDKDFIQVLAEYREAFRNDLYLVVTRAYRSEDFKKLHRLSQLSSYFNIPLVATNDVYYHHLMRRELQDVLTCIREKRTIYNAGLLLLGLTQNGVVVF